MNPWASTSVRHWAFEELPDAVVIFDSRGVICEANRAARELFGLTNFGCSAASIHRFIPRRFARRLLGLDGQRIDARVVEAMRGRWWRAKAIRPTRDEFPIEAAIKRAPGVLRVTYVAFVRDVAERTRERHELLHAREEAVCASAAKSEFLANMSHEIRTPLNAVIGMADLLAETPLEEDQRKYVSICRRAGRTLLAIVNDILDLSKIEAGQLQLETIDFDLHALIETVGELMALRAHEKDLNFAVRIAPDAPQSVRGDPNRVRQIALNLLGNAIKFTQRGDVVLELSRLDARGGAVLSVRDSGVGMPPEFLRRMFDKFAQADSSITRKHGGTGLGLAISKRLADAMGGEIEVRSRPGEGSEFMVRLPLEASDKVHLVKAPSWFVGLEGTRTLLVDESAASAQALTESLEGWGARVTAVADAASARARLRSAANEGAPFQLALVSAKAMGSAGREFAREARLLGDADFKMFLMANDLSGVGTEADGWDAAIARPPKRSELMETIARSQGRLIPRGDLNGFGVGMERAADRSSAPQSSRSERARAWKPAKPRVEPDVSSEPAAQAPGANPRVLLVEDSPDNRALVQAYMRSSDFRLDVAEDGAAGAQKAMSERYALVLMDMQMPVMDGYSATREIRRWEREKREARTPILALTAHALRVEVRRCLDAGCDGHLAKPVNKSQLLEAIQIFAKGVERNGRVHQRPPGGAGPGAERSTESRGR